MKEENLDVALSCLDLEVKTTSQLTWIEKIKSGHLENKLTNKSSSSSDFLPDTSQQRQTPQQKPKLKTYRRSSFSALINTPILSKRSDKKKHVIVFFL